MLCCVHDGREVPLLPWALSSQLVLGPEASNDFRAGVQRVHDKKNTYNHDNS